MSRRRRRRTPGGSRARIVGMIVLAVVPLVLLYATTRTIPFIGGEDGREYTVVLPEARQVSDTTPVRVAGVDVGRVDRVEPVDGGRTARVVFRITDDDVELRQGASAALRFRTFLGGRMQLVVDPGSPTAPALAGDALAAADPPTQTEVDDVLAIFDLRTREAQQAVLRELPAVLEDEAAGELIDALPRTLRSSEKGFRALTGERPGDLRRLVVGAARVVNGTGRASDALGRMVSAGARTFDATASGDLGATFAAAPAALAEVRSTAPAVDRLLPELDGLLADLDPLAPDVARTASVARPTVRELNLLLRDARPLTADLDRAVRATTRAATPGTTLIERLEPTVDRLRDKTIPMLQKVDSDAKRPLYQIIGPTIESLSAFTARYGTIGHFGTFGPQAGPGSNGVLPCTIFVANPTESQLVRCQGLNAALRAILGGGRK